MPPTAERSPQALRALWVLITWDSVTETQQKVVVVATGLGKTRPNQQRLQAHWLSQVEQLREQCVGLWIQAQWLPAAAQQASVCTGAREGSSAAVPL